MPSSSHVGYYRFPTLHADRLVFVSEDDLFEVPVDGGVARRLTASPGRNSHPHFSPDGRWLAYASRDEGHTEAWVMPSEGGESRRLTFTGGDCVPVAWTPQGEVVVASAHQSPFESQERLFTVPPEGGPLTPLPFGPATALAFGPGGQVVLGRNTRDPARWKRYRGGTVGQLWLAPSVDGPFTRLELEGNLAAPMWVGDALYFLSDREGHGNLFACTPTPAGEGPVTARTHHQDFYVRSPATDGARVAYHAGGELFIHDPSTGESRPVPVRFATARAERQRRFVEASDYLQGFDLHPKGHSLAVVARGQLSTLGNWEGAVLDHGEPGERQRLVRWLPDGKRLVMVTDAPGEETLEVRRADGAEAPRRVEVPDLGRVESLEVAPVGEQVALTNHRHALWLVALETGEARQLDRSEHGPIEDPAFSPDGRWLAYSVPISLHTAIIRVCEVATGTLHDLTPPLLDDWSPAWDPKGRYLYFLSTRSFEPVHDGLHFDLGFPRGQRPHLVVLRKDLPSPFVQQPRPLKGDEEDEPEAAPEAQAGPEGEEAGATAPEAAGDAAPEAGPPKPEPVEIDFDDLHRRVLAFPVPEGRYEGLWAVEGKVLWTQLPVHAGDDEPGGSLHAWEFERQSTDFLAGGLTGLRLSLDGSTLCYRAGDRLRVILAGEKAPEEDEVNRRGGWVDLHRVRVSVDPVAEWRQMYLEAWRLQRDHFWNPGVEVDWEGVRARYLPLLDRVGSRSEFSDLMWEMQGELGTSHAYEFGGDYRPEPGWTQGHLGADLDWEEGVGWRVTRLLEGDSWDPYVASPLAGPGLDVQPGDLLLAINGRRLDRTRPPGALLVNHVGVEVALTLKRADAEPRLVTVRTLGSETWLRYREWVETNRRRVHAATDGKVGYLHVPDMGDWGYGEFHRGYLPESERDALIIDVRHNGGGNVSQLLLEKLMRRRVGFEQSRYGAPVPYPQDSPAGPMVCVTDELAGSDGDVFSHAFKLLGLGPLVGRRTWGGVVGIWPRHTLVDGGITTQPEFAFWFEDVGWKLENYGTEPDIEVDIAPDDWVARRDPQLDRAVEAALEALAARPPRKPEPGPGA